MTRSYVNFSRNQVDLVSLSLPGGLTSSPVIELRLTKRHFVSSSVRKISKCLKLPFLSHWLGLSTVCNTLILPSPSTLERIRNEWHTHRKQIAKHCRKWHGKARFAPWTLRRSRLTMIPKQIIVLQKANKRYNNFVIFRFLTKLKLHSV